MLDEPVNLAGRRLLLTGGTGFIGRSVLDYLVEAAAAYGGVQVCVVSRTPDLFLRHWPGYRDYPWLTFHRGDIESFVPPSGSFTDIVHAAADTHAPHDATAWHRQIVGGTRALLDYAAATGAERFLLLSSGAVYGGSSGEAPSEEAVLAATDSYGQAKIAAEQLCRSAVAEGRLIAVIARVFAVLGPHIPLDGPYAAGNFLRDALDPTRAAIGVRGRGTAIRTYLYSRDCAHWLMLLLRNGVPGAAYNVGSDEAVTIADLAARIGRVATPEKQPSFGREPEPSLRSFYVPDITRASGIGAVVTTPLDTAISLTAAAIAR